MLAPIVEAGGDPDDMLSTPETAAATGNSEQFYEIGRISGYGPPCIHVAPRVVRYKRADLVAWLKQRHELYAAGYDISRLPQRVRAALPRSRRRS